MLNNNEMKIYKVEIEKLSFEWGRFVGYELIGYYTDKDKAEKVAKDTYENRCAYVQGKTIITEVMLED